jgi:hypothetical protein
LAHIGLPSLPSITFLDVKYFRSHSGFSAWVRVCLWWLSIGACVRSCRIRVRLLGCCPKACFPRDYFPGVASTMLKKTPPSRSSSITEEPNDTTTGRTTQTSEARPRWVREPGLSSPSVRPSVQPPHRAFSITFVSYSLSTLSKLVDPATPHLTTLTIHATALCHLAELLGVDPVHIYLARSSNCRRWRL